MADRTAYITVRLNIHNPNVDEITDDDVQEIIANIGCIFGDVGDFIINDPEVCGLNK